MFNIHVKLGQKPPKVYLLSNSTHLSTSEARGSHSYPICLPGATNTLYKRVDLENKARVCQGQDKQLPT